MVIVRFATVPAVCAALVTMVVVPAIAAGATRVLVGPDGATRALNAVDAPYYSGQMALFDSYFGARTRTLPPVTEAVVVGGVVTELSSEGNSVIPAGGYVLSASDRWLSDNLQTGDRVSVRLSDGMDGAQTVTHPLSGTNITRDTDMLVAYSQRPGRKSTGTNEWGFEAVVTPAPTPTPNPAPGSTSGIISAIGGNNNAIPPGGFVLSGHGASSEWLAQAASVGSRVDMSGPSVSITTDPSAWLALAKLTTAKLEAATPSPAGSGALAYNLAAARELIIKGEAALAAGNALVAVDAALSARDIAACSLPLTKSSSPVEARGVWTRTAEETPEAICRVLDALADANVNLVLPEVFYGGRTLYPSALTEQLPQFDGWDPLEVWVKEAHARGIEVHAWVHIFNWGEAGPGPLLEAHPEWAAVQKDGSLESTLEPGLYYADPANPAVRDFMSALLAEMTSKYALDGIELDYIRYSSNDAPEYSSSYSDYSRQAFKSAFGADPLSLSPKDKLWAKWTAWRTEQVTEFVRRIRAAMKVARPELQLSAAVFPNPAEAKSSKLQDWLSWVQQGLVDYVSPMVYSTDAVWVGTTARAVAKKVPDPSVLVPGIAPFLGLGTEGLLDQIDAVRASGARGVAMFALHSLKGGQLSVLEDGPFRVKAKLP